MKESIGGAFMLRILIVFVIVFVTFIGIALNIAKVYRIKNGVINILEQGQYSGEALELDDGIGEKLHSYFERIPYTISKNEEELKNDYCKDSVYFEGVCIIPGNSSSAKANYYKVIVFMDVEFPFFDVDLTIPFSGETMTIRK